MFKSLKNRLLTYFFIANLVVFVSFSTFVYLTAERGVSDTLNAQLKILSMDAIVDLLDVESYSDAKEIAADLKQEFGINPLEIKIIYYNKAKKEVEHVSYSSQKAKELFEIPLNVMGHLYSIYYFDKADYRVSSMSLFEDANNKIFFQVGTKVLTDTHYLRSLLKDLLIAVPLLLLLLFIIASVLLSKSLTPVKVTIEAVENITAHDLSERLSSKDAPLEIKALIDTFNALLSRLEETFERISSFSADASHELKTPLTVIRGEAEIGLRHERSPQEYKEILKHVIQESKTVQETMDQLFLLTKKDTKELSGNFQEVYVDEILSELVQQNSDLAKEHLVKLTLKKLLPVSLTANETLLKIALNNIIRNAILYSNEGDEIDISLGEEESSYLLKIEDEGSGISSEDLPFVFERFYRVDKARSRQAGGTGLGLAIVKMILDIHHYTIEIHSVLNEGTQVVIHIPKS